MRETGKEDISSAGAEDNRSQGTRIAKNTVYLYVRTLMIMIVSLYTSRIALHALGDADYGIYNLVAGIVVFFGFLNFAMERASMRFLLVEKGIGTDASMLKIFNLAISSHLIISLVVLVVGETVGLWFVNYMLNIPEGSMVATNVVYQLALITTIFNVIRVPYNASIIAYEKMSFYAWFSIIECVLRLGAVFAITLLPTDIRLQGYALSWALVTIIVFLVYKIFCTRCFKTCYYRFMWDKAKFKEMIIFSGWSLLGGIGNISAQQGISVILNIFFGVVVNAAMGIAYQVGQALNNVIRSFQTAFNPYVVKTFSRGEIAKLRDTLSMTSRYSLYLASIMIVPIILNIDLILHVWLGKDVPQYTADFCCIYMIFFAIDAVSEPLMMANQATGKVKVFNIIWTMMLLSNLPVCWICLKMGLQPQCVFWVRTAINFLIYLFRTIYIHLQIGLDIARYLADAFLKPVAVLALGIVIPVTAWYFSAGWTRLCITLPASLLCLAVVIWTIGMNNSERAFAKEKLFKKRLQHG